MTRLSLRTSLYQPRNPRFNTQDDSIGLKLYFGSTTPYSMNQKAIKFSLAVLAEHRDITIRQLPLHSKGGR